MRAGELRWTVAIESPPTTYLESGEPDPDAWVPVTTRRASIVQGPGSKGAGAGQQQTTDRYEVKMRLCLELETTFRMVVTGAPYQGAVMYVTSVNHTLTETIAQCVIGFVQ